MRPFLYSLIDARPPLRADAARLIGCIALAAALGCVRAPEAGRLSRDEASLTAMSPGVLSSARVTDHVVVISVDGLRPDAIDRFGARTIQRLMRGGRYTLAAQTILPSKTLPSHTSMLTGVSAEEHGITWNSDRTEEEGHVDVPTVFGLARAKGFRTAAFFSKTKFHHLEAPETLDHVRSPGGGFFDARWSAEQTTAHLERHLESSAPVPNLVFVHLGEPDFAGHLFGWMSWAYGRAVRSADRAVSRILEDADARFGAGRYTVIITADHGGHGRGHGSEDPLDTTIPWITWGQGVESGDVLPAGIRTMDTAATILWLLGIEVPEHWVGQPVEAAFGGTESVAVAR